ncbi:hypothetical protein [Kribbella speibonae]|uniref:SGNH hydrolase-type esterase domain-containing protein n=1 Tax=Kribbella speibonae TaxID=1572660 RepID=A0A4R0IRY9_9ACTN|nr:hypothetical protein [Kribbella speibonae]TCC27250.1 hypothetical protein E0H58_04505 [Kribbella speibonae]TCC35899.1 hypothetical protein E0H92_24690 [Kribbella speibonae]
MTGLGLVASPAHADGPGSGTPYVVTVGDSYISGEAGRWAGSSNDSEAPADALGAHAYHDNATHTAELIPKCHRSLSAEAYVGGGVGGLNLACSGARTTTGTGSDFKPGLDFYDDGAGKQGQAKMLQAFAATHNVKQVVVSIGGNDFNFASVVTQCVQDFLLSPSWNPDYCRDDSSVVANFTSSNVTAVRAKIAAAFQNIRTAMRNAGYGDSAWNLVVQTYPSPIPAASGFRYGQTGYTRQSVGGCGFWNADADWANSTALVTINTTVRAAIGQSGLSNARLLELQSAFNGRRLCEKTVGLYEEVGLSSWTQPTAVDKTEWINQIRTVTTVGSNYYIQESLHPNYWAQLALRSCVRQTYTQNRGGTCTIAGTGLLNGEPRMTLN